MSESGVKVSRRKVLAGAGAAAVVLSAPRLVSAAAPAKAVTVNDASGLNPTRVARHLIAGQNDEVQFLADLRNALRTAAEENRPISFGCARHSMGGQSLYRDSTTITFASDICMPDHTQRSFIARGGTRWSGIIKKIDPLGFSPKVMQSNHDFGIAGTLSVNAHGWPAPHGPFGSTVRRLRLMLADGTVVTCSRDENAELFGLVVGGYGLFGIIIDADVEMTDNLLLEPRYEILSSRELGPRVAAYVANDPKLNMVYGRLSVDRHHLLDESLLVTYRPLPSPPNGLPPARPAGLLTKAAREIFRAQVGSEQVKNARWYLETILAPSLISGSATRNTLLNEPASSLAGRDRFRTDILHEYFVPPERLGDFLAACKTIIGRSRQELLNVTLRYLAADRISRLAYAPEPRIAAVMLFTQLMTPEAERDMRSMTEGLIDSALDCGGSFYLPYRLHARRDQVRRAYPRLDEFIARKRHYDPQNRFRNMMWDALFI